MNMCGLSSSAWSVIKLRVLVLSLKSHKLPVCKKQVAELLKKHGQPVAGPGFRSPQQRALQLLYIMDPGLKPSLGADTLKTGDYEWHDGRMKTLRSVIADKVKVWVIDGMKGPPSGYDTKNPDDMARWDKTKSIGLRWAESVGAMEFAKLIYNINAATFTSVTKLQDRKQFRACLEEFFRQKRLLEEAAVNDQLKISLQSQCDDCKCKFHCFSFIYRKVMRAVFDYFTTQVSYA